MDGQPHAAGLRGQRDGGQHEPDRRTLHDGATAAASRHPGTRHHRAGQEGGGGSSRLRHLVPQQRRAIEDEQRRDGCERRLAECAQEIVDQQQPCGHGGRRQEDRGPVRAAAQREGKARQGEDDREHRAGEIDARPHRASPAASARPLAARTADARRAASIPSPNDPLIVRSWGWSWQESVRKRFATGVWIDGVLVR